MFPGGLPQGALFKKRVIRVYCPVCKKSVKWEDNPFRPFCSERCKMVDLGTWAAEGYRISGENDNDEQPCEDRPEKEGIRRA